MLLLLLGGDVSLNPGPIALGVLNARLIRNKGPALPDTMAANDLDMLCLTETHARSSDTDGLLCSVTALSDDIQAAPSLATLRRRLKTYLYNKAYPP